MGTFEQKIMDAVTEKLNDGTVEKLVGQYIEKGVSDALGSIFSYGGKGRGLIEEKLRETIVPAIEGHDFNKYLTKLDTVLTEIVGMTSIADNKEILGNFKELMKEPELKEIKLSEIFMQYCRHVAADVDVYGLEAQCEDGQPYYEHVAARMEVEHTKPDWCSPDYDDCIVKFTCGHDEKLNCQVKLFKSASREKWRIAGYDGAIDLHSLRGLDSFEIFLMVLRRGFVWIAMDTETDYDDDIEPEEKPEWSLI